MHDQIIAYLAEKETEAVSLLRRLVEIQSGSRNKPGLDLMADAMSEVLGDILPDVRILPFADYGNMVQAFSTFLDDGEICRGPGVYDMKGGLVVGVYALKALRSLGVLNDMPITFLCNSDEEIGSPASRPWIEEQAGRCLACLVFEGGGLNREVVTGRKGRLGLRVTVRGRAGHAAKCGLKASAILELAYKIMALEALNDDAEITVNVGHVEGGIGPNTVPELAQALVDARFLSPEGQSRLRKSLAALFAEQVVPGTSCEHIETTGRPAMPQTEANKHLYASARKQAAILGYDLQDELRFGVSDANFIADQGVPVLDGLGPLGDLDHSDREYIDRRSLMERAALVASLLLDLWVNRSR